MFPLRSPQLPHLGLSQVGTVSAVAAGLEPHVREQSQCPRPGTVSPCHPKARAQPLPSCCASEEGLGQRKRLLDKGSAFLPGSCLGRLPAKKPGFRWLSRLLLVTSGPWQDPCPLPGDRAKGTSPHTSIAWGVLSVPDPHPTPPRSLSSHHGT